MSCCPCPFTIYHCITTIIASPTAAIQPFICCHIDCIHHICHIYRICRKVPNLLPCQISVAVLTAIIETVDMTGRNRGSANLEMIIRYK